LETIAKSCEIELHKNQKNQAFPWVSALNHAQRSTIISRPAPTPPVDARPARLSVTSIETWLKDPYALYAKEVLNLKKLGTLHDDKKAAIKGTIIHNVLDWFIKTHPETIPNNAIELLLIKAREEYNNRFNEPSLWSFWEPQLSTAFIATISSEIEWRASYKPFKNEVFGSIFVNGYKSSVELVTRADRIDKVKNDPCDPASSSLPKTAIIDYKSGGTFSKKMLERGQYPQLILEALILRQGGFKNISPMSIAYLGYWIISSGSQSSKVTSITDDLDALIDTIHEKLIHLIDAYADETTPYLSIPNPANQPRFNDYLHLARIREWSDHLDNADDQAEDNAA
jgi:ATP-dependent helicase/nuclease subunit B